MKVQDFAEIIGADFYTGVPDSQLKALCSYLMDRYGIDGRHHIIAANEGNCAARGVYAEQRRGQYHKPCGKPAE
ncbi:N-acetylmuramoyl-L-alanine amidase [uncultured Ruminococcus sp.]|uniref:peptidoglycan recognition protein family protein n=1 Tax=uncultured Ruminococcus sp. TaxID=165186 RepID=UPI00345A9954